MMALKSSVSVTGSVDTAFCDRQSVIGLKIPDRSTSNIKQQISFNIDNKFI